MSAAQAPTAEAPTSRRALCSGNELIAWGALAAGCTFFSGYPITPASEIYAEMMRRLPEQGGVAVGAPDEITALSYAVGASLTGALAMTATSGPGWCLMIETFQYALMTETPLVIAVSQRLGPATGAATQGAQGDLALVSAATSGGYPFPVLSPTDGKDAYVLTAEAFRLAETLRTPVVLLTDKEVSKTVETIDLAALPEIERVHRAPPAADRPFVPYGIDALEDVPTFAPVGGKYKVTVTGSAHDSEGRLKKNSPEVRRQLLHLAAKITARPELTDHTRLTRRDGAKTLLLSFGVSARATRQAGAELASADTPVDVLEVLSLYPVPTRALEEAAAGKDRILVVEENLPGLYAREVRLALPGANVLQVNDIGAMISPDTIREAVLR